MSTYSPRKQNTTGEGYTYSTPASTTLFRRLVWEGTVPLEIKVDSKELPAGSERGLESYYVQAPRVSYLPLLVPDIKRHLAELVLDEAGLNSVKDEDWWFEREDGGLMKWHWPVGLLYDCYMTSTSLIPGSSDSAVAPLRLILHLTAPPTDKLLMSPSAEACKQAFMGQLKEADFVRWGNTKRVTGLRKGEQDGMWDGVREHNFEDFWRVGGKVTPTTALPPTSLPGGSALHPRAGSVDSAASTGGDREGAYQVRSVPARIYLPDGPGDSRGGTVMQELVPPVGDDGRAVTLAKYLNTHLPLLFSTPSGQSKLAYALVQGVVVPIEAEMAWLGACLAGADGWVNVCVGLLK